MKAEAELLAHAAEMRRNPTEWETRLWRELSGTKIGHKFRRQHVIAPYITDLFCPAKGLVVEIDDDTHDRAKDAARDRFTAGKGFRTLRFTNFDIRDNIDGVPLTIVATLRTRPGRWSGLPHPNPSPEGEGLSG